MKKFFLMLMVLMMALTTLTAFAEDATPSPEADELADFALLDAFVMNVTDESILLMDRNGMNVEAWIDENTVVEGKDLAIGDYVQVVYNGMMTRSLPAQITAQAIRNNMLMGIVSEMTEEGFLLTFGEDMYQVNAEASLLEGIQDGMFVTVYHFGMMTRSIPAMVTAQHIRGQEIVGTVTEMAEGGFILTVEGEEIPYHVAIKENAIQFVTAEPGMEVVVIIDGMQTASLESILVNATEILPLATAQELQDMAGTIVEMGEGFILIETLDGQQIQVNVGEETLYEGAELSIGSFIHVTHNGQMTMSIPAQIFGLKIGCYMHIGTVTEIVEGQFALETEDGLILVNATAEQLEGLTVGQNVYVFSNGVMTMSLPAQISADLIVARSR